jgi:hypothetical protein
LSAKQERHTLVVTYSCRTQTGRIDGRVDLCTTHREHMDGGDHTAEDALGCRVVQVYHGAHLGVCDACMLTK